jgi:flagellar basal-body rod protein FlgG
MSLRGILDTARSLSFHLRLQEVTANNLSNANTDAYKADRLTAHRVAGSNDLVPVQKTDLEQGRVRDTGRPLDVALEGSGYFVVLTDRGERLTRGVSLRLDPAGRLVDPHGDPVLAKDGPVVVSGSVLEIDADGRVHVDGLESARLRIENVDDPSKLMKEGYGRYRVDGARLPVVPGGIHVRQGAIEEPNVDPVLGMVDLVTLQRAYTANLDALRVMDGVLGSVTNEVGKL